MSDLISKNGEIVLYGDVGDIWGDGSGFSAKSVIDALGGLEGPLNVRLNSGGGLAYDGVAIFNALKAYDGEVTISVDAIAASAASVIAMAGDKIYMREGAQMMIHDPSGVTIGDAEAHEKSANVLNRLGDQTAAIYASRSGMKQEEVRELMLAETWLDADEAIKLGFATQEMDDSDEDEDEDEKSAAVQSFDWRLYHRVPDCVLRSGVRPLPGSDPVATATLQKRGNLMSHEKDVAAPDSVANRVDEPVMAADPAPQARAEKGKDHTLEIMKRCNAAGLDMATSMQVVESAGNNVLQAADLIIEQMRARDPSPVQASQHASPAVVQADGHDKFLEGAEKALMARAGLDGGEHNEFSGMTMLELGRETMLSAGIPRRQLSADRMTLAEQALRFQGPRMEAGMHSTSDFTTVLANVANKSLLVGYEETPETYEAWTRKGSLPDFKVANRVDLNLFPSLSNVPEGAEYSYGTVSDRGSTIVLATYGKMFAITRQALVNDDLSTMSRQPNSMGRAARRTVGDLCYALVTANGLMPDGFALFASQHNNLAASGSAPSVSSVDAARVAMALQTDPDSHATALNLRPSYMLVPVALEGTARVLMASEFDPAGTGGERVPNSVRGIVSVIPEARLDADSSTAWYMAASPSAVDTVEVAYLNGNSSPVLETRDGWNVDGVEFKVRLDCGVQVHDFRGLYKDPGV